MISDQGVSKPHVSAPKPASKFKLSTKRERTIRKALLATLAFSALDNTLVNIEIQRLPFLANELNVNSDLYGYVQATLGVALLIGGPIYGQLSDLKGVRFAMCIATLSGFASYLVLAMSQGFWWMMASRSLCMFFQGMLGTQTVITKVTSVSERAKYFTRTGMVMAIGSIIGPTLSGLLNRIFSARSIFFITACLYLAYLPILRIFIPSKSRMAALHQQLSASDDVIPDLAEPKFELRKYVDVMKYSSMKRLMFIRTLGVGTYFMLDAVLTLFMIKRFGLTEEYNAVIGVYVGTCNLIVNAVIIAQLQRVLRNLSVLRVGFFAFTYSFAMFATAFTDSWLLFIILPGISVGNNVVMLIADIMMTKAVPKSDTGTLLGLRYAGNYLTMSIAPALSGTLMQQFSFQTVCLTAAVIDIFGIILTINMSEPPEFVENVDN